MCKCVYMSECVCDVLGGILSNAPLLFLFSTSLSPHSLSMGSAHLCAESLCLPGCSGHPDSAKGSEIPAPVHFAPAGSCPWVSHKPSGALGPWPAACPWRFLKALLPLTPPSGFLHQLQLRDRWRPCASGLLRLNLQSPGAALHTPDEPGWSHGLSHPHTLLHAHPKVNAELGQTQWIPRGL